MNYLGVYKQFIDDRRTREEALEKGTFDIHHVLPRALGGKDNPENLIRLAYGDHLFAHILLAKMYGGRMAVCASRMSSMRKYAGRRSRERYEWLRRRHREAQTGVRLTEEHRRKIGASSRASKIGNKFACGPKTEEHRRKIGEAHRGMKRSDETRARLRAAWVRRKERQQEVIRHA